MAKLFFAGFCLFLLSACATYPSRVSQARTDLLSGNCEAALIPLEKLSAEDSGDRLLHLMEYGSALQICGDFASSNRAFLAADKLSEQIDYHSASRVVGATLLNEEMIQYKGDIFERLFINASAALNFIEMGKMDDAMVEVRRINEKYMKFSAEEKNSYELNSFSQYLAGLIYEVQGQHDDACIAYRSSYELDKSFRNVGVDMLSACWRAKRYAEYDRLSRDLVPTPEEIEYIRRKTKNEVVIFYLQGLGPQKRTRSNDQVFPYLEPTFNITKKILASYEDEKKQARTQMSSSVYSVEKAAIATLEADYNALALRRVGSRVAKEVVADQIRQKDKTLGNVAWLVMVLAERADLRNWSLLPESIQIVRVNAASGSKINLVGLGGYETRSESFAEIDLSLNPRKKVYVIRGIK